MKKIRSANGISEYRLENGLRVLYCRDRTAPVVAVCVTYHVGSRNEAKGHTGSTHILEHLLFKDSKNFNEKNGKPMAHYIEWFGAQWNATTWLDRTNYFEMLPAEYLEEALAMEADRMRGSLFTAKDLESEMTVVRNEYERGRNDPFELLDESIVGKAYTKHPYRIPTIGTKEDIENSTVEKLREFYDTFYWPNNATLMVAGDVPLPRVLSLVKKYFAPLPHSPRHIPKLTVKEPPQKAPRKVVLKKPMGVSLAALYYKIPAARHPDYPACAALAAVLGQGFSSRLERSLVDTGLAAGVTSYAMAYHDPGYLSITAQAAEGVAPAALLKIMRKEVEALKKGGITKAEILRAKERMLTYEEMQRDGVLRRVQAVSEAVARGDWTLEHKFTKAVRSLTPAAVTRAARRYLVPAGETSGVLENKQ